MGAQKVEVIASMASLPVVSPNGPGWGARLEEVVPAIMRAGYSGLEAWPHNNLTESIVDDVADPQLLAWIRSTHQAALSGLGGRLMSRFVPASVESVGNLRKIQNALPKPVRANLYPRTLNQDSFPYDRYDDDNTGTNIRAAQPEEAVFRDYKLKGPEDYEGYMELMDALGIPYICDDPAHFLPKFATRQKYIQGGRLVEAHVPGDRWRSLRKRSPGRARLTRESARIFVEGTLGQAKDSWLGGLVINTIGRAQLPPETDGLLTVAPEPDPRLFGSVGEYVDAHAPFVERIQQMAEFCGATVVPQPELPRGLA